MKLIDPSYAMYFVRNKKNLNDMKIEIRKIYNNPLLDNKLNKIFFPRTCSEIHNSQFKLNEINFENELFWYSMILEHESKKLNKFIALEKNYESLFLIGNYEKAEYILNTINSEFGYSIWTIEQKLNIIEMKDGTEAQKIVRTQYTNDMNINIIDRINISLCGLRAEKSVSFNLYNFYLKYFNKNYEEYFLFQHNFYGYRRFNNLSKILHENANSSIIDILNTFIKMCQYIYSLDDLKYKKILIKVIKNVKNINDTRLKNLYSLILNDFKKININSDNIEIISVLDEYTKGNYLIVINKIKESIRNEKFYGEYLEILAKSYIRINKRYIIDTTNNNIINSIVMNMEQILRKEKSYVDAVENLQKIISMCQNQSWSAFVNTFLSKYIYYNDKQFKKFGIISTFLGNPLQGYIIDDNLKDSFFQETLKVFPKSLTIKLHYFVCNDSINAEELDKIQIPNERNLKYKAKKYEKLSNYEQAKKMYYLLYKSNNILNKYDALEGILKTLIQLNDFSEAINLIASNAIKSESSVIGCPIKELLEKIEQSKEQMQWNNINFPITYYVYNQLYDKEKVDLLGISCDKFLRTNKVTRPSQLNLEKFPKKEILYFLKKICTINVLDFSYDYDSSEDIEKERILICQKLTTLDDADSQNFSKEIKKLTQNIILKKHIRQIESGKIHVDTEAMKNHLRKSMKLYYERFLKLDNNDEIKYVLDIIDTLNNSSDNNISYEILNDEKKELFTSLFFEFRNNFTAAEYGLENCLSTGIRHGVLTSSLRKSFEREHLITVKDNKTGKYIDNVYWKDKLILKLTDKQLNKILKILNTFSKKVDDIIEYLKKEYIQIRTDNKNENGLLDFRTNQQELRLLQEKCNSIKYFDDFADTLFEYFWTLTNQGLLQIQKKINVEIKKQFHELINNLIRDINLIAINNECNDLLNHITQMWTNLQQELHRIAKWFERPRDSNIDDYTMDLPINISKEILNNINPINQIPLKIINSKNHITLKGSTLRHMVDIIYIILDNAIKHTNLPKDKLQINISYSKIKNDIKLYSTNNTEVKDNFKTLNNNFKSIKKKINNNTFLTQAHSEGGSGFFKIAKILKYDFKCHYYINFGYKNKKIFFVRLKFNLRNISI